MTSPHSSSVPFPAGPVSHCRGRAVAIRGHDIDTDRIIPARFLKCVSFDGLAAGAFADDRLELEGSHPLDHPESQAAPFLVVNSNFGCGSSREHAPQALMRWGVRALIGESFAEIFFGNCLALGIPCLSASHQDVEAIQAVVSSNRLAELELDLAAMELILLTADSGADGSSQRWSLSLPAGAQRRLLSGHWDSTSQLVAHHDELLTTAAALPYLNDFNPA